MTTRIEPDFEKKKIPAQQATDEPDEGGYGFGGWTPKFLQWINNPKGFLAVMFSALTATTMLSAGLQNVNAVPLERRFGLDSTQTGLIMIGYDIGFAVMTLFVSYYGMNASRPKMCAVGATVFGMGGLVYSLPHFITENYNFGSDMLQVTCPVPGANTTDCFQSESSSGYMSVLFLGFILMGFGSTPFFTLGMAYLEDSVPKDMGPIYLGIAHAAAVLGPAIGFLAGGKFLLEYFVDFDKGIQTTLNVIDPRWVGAWWLGPLIAMAVSWTVAIPLVGFPKQLPGTNKVRCDRVSEAHNDGGSKMARSSKFGTIREFPKAFRIIVHNPVFVCITLATSCHWLVLSGMTSFLAKFIENEFHIPTGRSAMLTGAVVVPAGALGQVGAGILITRMKWKTPIILKLTIVSFLLVAVLSPVGFVHCNNDSVAGITVPYAFPTNLSNGVIVQVNETLRPGNLTAGCNANCSCQEEFFIPVCGDDGKTYFSPCHAGCIGSNSTNGSTSPFEYNFCRCVLSLEQKSFPAACTTSCRSLPVFLAIMFFITICFFAPLTTSMVMTFRVVPEKMRSFAVGVQFLFVRALGTIPGPLIYGSLIDLTCILWQTRQCDGSRGQCWIHNNKDMNIAYSSLAIVLSFLAALLYLIATCVYKPEYDVSVCSSEKLAENRHKDFSTVDGSELMTLNTKEMSDDL